MPKVYTSDETKLKTYRQRVNAAITKFETEVKSDAEENIRLYENELDPDDVLEISSSPTSHVVTTPTGTGVIDSMFASLTAIDVTTIVENVGAGTIEQARVSEKAIQEVWRDAQVQEESDFAIKDALLTGLGWVKVGYDYYETNTDRRRTEEDIESDVNRMFESAINAGVEPPSPDIVAKLVPLTEKVVEVQRDQVVVNYIPYDEVFYDPTAKRAEDIRWICQVSRVPVDDVRGNTVFHEYAGKKKVESISPDAQLDIHLVGNRELTEDDEMVTLFEFWDFETGTVTWFLREQNFVLNEAPNPFGMKARLRDRNPYVPLILRRRPGKVRGISDMDVIAPAIAEKNVYRSNIATWLERAKPKLFGPDGAFGQAGREAIESQEWLVYVPLEADTNISASDVQPITPPQLPAEMFAMLDRIDADILESTGVSELMRGLFPQGGKKTATETVEVVAASNARQSEKRNLMERFYRAIAMRILHLILMFYDENRISRHIELGQDVVWEWNADDLSVENDLSVELAPKQPKNFEVRKENAFMLLNILGTIEEVDKRELVIFAMSEMGIPMDVVRKFVKTEEEVQVEKQQRNQDIANESAASEGVAPDPSGVAGPLASDELLLAANPGELPAEFAGAAGANPVSDQVLAEQ